MPKIWVKVEFSAMPVTIPGQRERQDHQERDRLAAEEAVAGDGERGASVPRISATAVASRPVFIE